MNERGMIHLITGDGAGKTTAAFGSVLRFCAYGEKALVIQFLKSMPSGECISLQSVPGADVLVTGKSKQFYPDMTQAQRAVEEKAARDALHLAMDKMKAGAYQMIVLDEAGGAVQNGMLTEDEIMMFLTQKLPQTELILTGRSFPERIMAAGDYCSEIRCVKHPYEKGVPARRGIEF